MTTGHAVRFFDATIEYPAAKESLPVKRARFAEVDGKRVFLAEWEEEDIDWSMRLISPDGVTYRGSITARDEESIEVRMQLWTSADGRRSMLDGVFALEELVHWQIVLEPPDVDG
jgi:hypothetical protein